MRKAVPGYEGIYEVDDLGNIYSLARYASHGRKRFLKARMLTPQKDTHGYLHVNFVSLGDKRKYPLIHRIVLSTFLPVDNVDSVEVNHKDGDKTNNKLTNLEWSTRSKNILHSYRELGRAAAMTGKFGADHPSSVPIIGLDKETGEERVRFDSIASAHRAGYDNSGICKHLVGKLQSCKGLVWRRVNG